VIEARKRYDLEAPIALGYSNGANIAAAMMLLRPDVLAGGILLRAMVPLRLAPPADMAGKRVLIVSGQSDPIIPPSNSAALSAMLQKAGAEVEHRTLPVGHQLSQADLTVATEWLERQSSLAVQ
jgi:phospholipase/carboxylesterase